MDNEQTFPVSGQTVLDATDPRRLAEFYRQRFGLRYVPGDEPPGARPPGPARAGLADPDEPLWRERALALGAGLIEDRSDDPQEPLRVYAYPAAHSFCTAATTAHACCGRCVSTSSDYHRRCF